MQQIGIWDLGDLRLEISALFVECKIYYFETGG